MMESSNTFLFRKSLALKSAQLVIVFIVLALVTCNLIVEQNRIFTYLGLVDLVIAVVTWQLISRKIVVRFSAHLVVATCWVYMFPLILLSGGTDSHFIYLLPMSPLMAGLVFNSRAAFHLFWFLSLNIVALLYLVPHVPNYSIASYDVDEARLKAYWLILSMMVSTVFVIYYHHFNKAMSHMLKDQALRDPLTGLFNRRSIGEMLEVSREQVLNNSSKLALIMVDLDDFKGVNDNYGHNVGDRCLKEVAKVLKACMPGEHDAVGRWGGEEFMIILTDVSEAEALEAAESMRVKIERHDVMAREAIIKLTATLGCTHIKGPDVPTLDQLVNLADKAMYEGKGKGKNQVFLLSATDLDQEVVQSQ